MFYDTFFSLHILNINFGCDIQQPKKTLHLPPPPETHSQWFSCLFTSNPQSQHSMLHDSRIASYAASYTFSPTTTPLHHFFCKQRLFFKHPLLLHFGKANTQTGAAMSSNSSVASSKVSIKRITHLPSPILLNIYSNSIHYILCCFVQI